MTGAAVVLAFAAGVSVGFTLGRVFERWQWHKLQVRMTELIKRIEELET